MVHKFRGTPLTIPFMLRDPRLPDRAIREN